MPKLKNADNLPVKDDALNTDVEDNFALIKAKSWTTEYVFNLFNLSSFVAAGYYHCKESFWAFTHDTLVSHAVLNKVIVKFNSDFSDVVEGTKSRRTAEYPYAATDNNKLPLGEDIHSVQASGPGTCIGFKADGTFDVETLVTGYDFSYAEKQRKLIFGAEDVIAGVCGNDEEFTYSPQTIALATDILSGKVTYRSMDKTQAKNFLDLTLWFETRITASFNFDKKDFGIVNVKEQPDRVVAVNRYIRSCVTKQLAKIAQAAGVKPGQYCEFVFCGLSHSAKTVKGKGFGHAALFANFTFDVNTNLPAGMFVMCQPVGESTYKASTRINAPRGRAARMGISVTSRKAVDMSGVPMGPQPLNKVEGTFDEFLATNALNTGTTAEYVSLNNNAETETVAPTVAKSLLNQTPGAFRNLPENDDAQYDALDD